MSSTRQPAHIRRLAGELKCVCKICGEFFVAKNWGTQYCGGVCRNTASRARKMGAVRWGALMRQRRREVDNMMRALAHIEESSKRGLGGRMAGTQVLSDRKPPGPDLSRPSPRPQEGTNGS